MERFRLLRSACIVLLLCAAAAIVSPAQTFTTLASFDGTDGKYPNALVIGADGNLYGTAFAGGVSNANDCPNGCGTIFEITPLGTLSTLQSFDGTQGYEPNGLVIGTDGKLYGTTQQGNTFFSIVPGGTLVTLYTFCSDPPGCPDGSFPNPVIQAAGGNFYGTTWDGTAPNECLSGHCGTVFEITPAGTLTTLYAFPGTAGSPPYAGYGPTAGLVQGTDGNFYGTTEFGGSSNCGVGSPAFCGTIFKITPAGALTTLYSFCKEDGGCTDGYGPSGLTLGQDGNFYGTTSGCPQYGACGTVFQITPDGAFTTLHVFDGEIPQGVMQGSDGNFYGTTEYGGPNNAGTIYRISPAGVFITLYESASPSPVLVQAANGTFYGTTGGGANDGTVFSFSIGLGGTMVSTTSLNLTPATVTVGAPGPVVVTATVAPASGSGTPTGVVNFFNASNAIGFADLSGGVGTISYNPSSLALGAYQITAIYSGDGTFATSTSSAQTLTVSSLPSAATPSFSAPSGTYSSPLTVTIADSMTGATIYFTTDGTIPTTDSEQYNGPITVSSTETINAIAGASGYLSSAVASATYTFSLAPDYQLSVTPTTLSIVAGQSGTAQFTVSPMNGFNAPVTFGCSGLPAGATCSFQPSAVTPSDGNPVSSTLTVSTTAASAASRPRLSPNLLSYTLLIPLFGLMLGVAPRRRSTVGGLRFFSIIAFLALAAGLTSCGGQSATTPPNTTAVTSTVTVTASTTASGATNQTASLTITITQ